MNNALPIGIIAFLLMGIAILYSIKIALSLLQSYWTATSARSGGIAIGLLLLTTVPITIRFGVGTVSMLTSSQISIIALSFEVVGLGVILTSLYIPRGENQ